MRRLIALVLAGLLVVIVGVGALAATPKAGAPSAIPLQFQPQPPVEAHTGHWPVYPIQSGPPPGPQNP